MPNIDELSIEIQANADKATQSIKNLTSSLQGLSTSLNRINTSGISKFAKSIESLSTVGRRTDETSRAVTKFADAISKNFNIKSKEGIDAVRNAMLEMADASKKFQQSGGDMALGDKLEDAQRNAARTIESYAKIKGQLDATTQSVIDYVKATNKGTSKISVSDMAKEFGENFKSMQKVLGSAFTSKLESTQKGVQDFAEYLNEMNSVLGTSFDTQSIDRGFEQLVATLEQGKNATLSYSDAVREGIVRESDARNAVLDYASAIDKIVKAEGELASNNGIDHLAESLTKLSNIQLPDFSSFADAINALNRASTDRVVKNINAVKQALDNTIPSADSVNETINNISDAGSNFSDNTHGISDEFSTLSGELAIAEKYMLSMASAMENFVRAMGSMTGRIALPDFLDVTDSYKELSVDAEDANAEFKESNDILDGTYRTISETGEGIKRLGAQMSSLANGMSKMVAIADKLGNIGIAALKKVANGAKMALGVLKTFGEYIANDFREKTDGLRKRFESLRKAIKSNLDKMSKFWARAMKTFTFMLVRKAITAIIDNVKEAIDELALFEKNLGTLSGGKFNSSLSEIIADFHYIGRAIVAAFEPLINFVVPALNAVANAVANVLALVGEFFAAFTGQNYFVKARKTVVDYGDSIDKNNEKLKEQKKLLLGIDELNVMPSQNDSSSGDSGSGVNFKDAFEEKPVSEKMKNLAEKVKDILSQLFEPLKKAWDEAGEYVTEGFKYMVKELGLLAKSIGRDFLTVWKQPETVEIFVNLLKIVGDLERVVGNLAKRFREAWDELTDDNITRGQSILEGIRNIIGTLVQHVRNVTKYMVEWSNKIDFKPLLTGIDNVLKKLNKVADFLGGVFEDVMKNIVLEHIRWLIEEGLPHLMHAIGEVIDAFDFEQLRSDLQPLEKAFEQMRQNIDEGLVNAMKNVGKAIGEWTQTQNFKDFLLSIENIMSKVTPERVEKLFTGLGMGIVEIVKALADFVASDEFQDFIDQIIEWYDSISADDIANFFKKIGDTIVILAKDLLKFVQSDAFQGFLKAIADWWNNVDANALAKGLEAIAGAVVAFKFTAFVGAPIAGFFNFLGKILAAKNLGTIAKGLKDVGGAAEVAGAGAKAAGASTAAGATSLAGVAVTAAAATADLALVAADFNNLKDASDTYSSAQKAHTKEVDSALTNLKKVYEKQGPEVAAEWAKTCYDVDISGQGLYDAQNTLWKKIDTEWEDVPQNMFDGFKQGWNEYFGADGKGIGQLAIDAFDQLVTGVEELLGIASPSTVFAEIGGYIVEGLWEGIKQGWTDFMTNIGLKIDEFKTSFSEGIGSFKDGVVTKFEELKNESSSKFDTFKQDTAGKISDATKEAIASAKEFKDKTVEKIKDIPKEAKSNFDEFKKTTSTKFGEVKKAIGDKMDESNTKVDEKLDKMKKKFEKIDLTRIANNIIRGFTSGLKSAWTDVITWANQAVASLKSKFAEALKIKSPSRVFMKYGEYTVEGFNQGISSFADTTSKTVDKWVSSFSDMNVTLIPQANNMTGLKPSGFKDAYSTSDSSSGLSKDELTSALDDFANKYLNRTGETRVILELDGKRIYEQMLRQDKHQIMRTGRSGFAY